MQIRSMNDQFATPHIAPVFHQPIPGNVMGHPEITEQPSEVELRALQPQRLAHFRGARHESGAGDPKRQKSWESLRHKLEGVCAAVE